MPEPHAPDDNPWGDVLAGLEADDDRYFDESLDVHIQDASEKAASQETDTDADYCKWLMKLRDTIQADIGEDGQPLHVLYPGSAAHTDVGDIFGAGNVLHVDPDARSMDVMEKHGYRTKTQTAEQYAAENPRDRYDVIVSHNAETLSEDAIGLLNPDGYVVANNHHGAAAALLARHDFRLVAGVVPEYVVPDAALVQAEDLDLSNGIDTERDKNILLLFQRSQ